MTAATDEVVVTGLGLITAVGQNVEECWAAIREGRSGIREPSVIPVWEKGVKVAGQATFALADDQPVQADGSPTLPFDRCHELARRGVEEALADSKLLTSGVYDPERIGLVLGTSLGGQRLGEKFHRQWLQDGLEHADGALLIDYPIDAVLARLAEQHGIKGPRCVQSNACAAGAVAIAFAMELLLDGQADAVITGGVDPLAYLSFGGFQTLGALDAEPCAPYTRSAGTSLGEGGGFLVLERAGAAEQRGATAVAVMSGYGLSADAYHATAPDPKGAGATGAMETALRMAHLEPGDVDYINGHGTGTPANDSSEPKAIKTLFKPDPPPVSSTKSMTGHTLGAAGAVEAVISVLAIRDQVLPPTAVPDGAESTIGLDIVPGRAREADVRAVVSNSFAFGGNNASLSIVEPEHPCLTRANDDDGDGAPRAVVITGIGAIAASAKDSTEITEAFCAEKRLYGDDFAELGARGRFPKAEIPAEHQKGKINPRYYRKMDNLGRRAAVAVAELMAARNLPRADARGTGVICSTIGPIESIETFERSLIERDSGNAKIFPNTVMNASAGYVALLNGFRGPTATHYGGGPAAVSALYLATRLIQRKHADRIIVLTADEVPDSHVACYSWLPGYLSRDVCTPFENTGRVLGGAAVAVLLEAADTTTADPLARITGFGMTGGTCGSGRLDADGEPWARSFDLALDAAGRAADEVDLFISDACGVAGIDDVETRARQARGLSDVPLFAPKAYVGDTRASSPMLGLLHALRSAGGPRTTLISSSDTGGSYGSFVVTVDGG